MIGGYTFDQLYLAVSGNEEVKIREIMAEAPGLARKRLPGAESWLHLACRRGSLDAVGALIDCGVDIEARDDIGATALMTAAEKGNDLVVSRLLAVGANVNAAEKYGETALVAAAREGNTQIVENLIRNGARLDVLFGDEEYSTVVQIARANDHEDVASLLTAQGAPESPPGEAGKPITDIDRLEHHVSSLLGPLTRNVATSVEDLINVHLVPAGAGRTRSYLFSSISPSDLGNGMIPTSDEHMDIQFAEVAIELPEAWPLEKTFGGNTQFSWPVHLMGKISWLPSLDNVWFGSAPLIVSNDDPPRPLGKGTQFTCTMLIKDASLPPLRMEYGKVVHFYTLVPLYTEERDFEKKHGLDALMELFHKAGVDYTIDPRRPNLAARRR